MKKLTEKQIQKTVIAVNIAILLILLLVVFIKKDNKTLYPKQEKQEQVQTEMFNFVSTVLADTENTWASIFKNYEEIYEPPQLILFSGYTQSECGKTQESDGPFYCLEDSKLYIDLDFLYNLKTRHNTDDNFALAYTIAHEIGHHIQNQWGILAQIDRIPPARHTKPLQEIPTNIELMADCLAGVWASRQDGNLSKETIKTGMSAAHNLIKEKTKTKSQGVAIQLTTHGSIEERTEWFTRGYRNKKMSACNTFWER